MTTALEFRALGVEFDVRGVHYEVLGPEGGDELLRELAKEIERRRGPMPPITARAWGQCDRCGDPMPRYRSGWCDLCLVARLKETKRT